MAQGPGLINRFRPTALSFNSYGWKGSPLYNRADVPAQWVEGVGTVDRTVIEQQLAYEWLNSSEAGGPGVIWTNPPFLSGAAGRLMPMMETANGTPARILRGFIRRSEADLSDIASMSRLYFMYNPNSITRDYVSYLDQGALDPFNTVFQSGNLVAPPSQMDFTFNLFFDRQEEAVIPSNPGVFVDYQYFDLVVRNVIPTTDPNGANNTLPDSGVMMVNPRDITVVFSPQITVQGRPFNAQINFTRFTNRMVPTRMEIALTMRVTYFGPLKDMVPYVKEEATTAATIPYSDIEDTYHINIDDLVAAKDRIIKAITDKLGLSDSDEGTGAPVEGNAGPIAKDIIDDLTNAHAGSLEINAAILEYTKQKVAANGTTYRFAQRSWYEADCSGLVWIAFSDMGHLGTMKWDQAYSTAEMWRKVKQSTGGSNGVVLFEVDGQKTAIDRKKAQRAYINVLTKGDLLFRINAIGHNTDHIAWFDSWKGQPGESDAVLYHSQSGDADPNIGPTNIQADRIASDYTGGFRPFTSGGDTAAATPRNGPG
jgi:hypothetical protein